MTKKNELVERMEAASPAGQSAQPTVVELLERQVPEIEKAVGDVVTARRLARLMASEIRANPGLMECTVPSLMGACMQSAQLHLEPGPLGHCYFVPIPKRKKKGNEWVTVETNAEWWLGYKGMIDLARRSGAVGKITAGAVHEGDEFSAEEGTGGGLHHSRDYRLSLADRGPVYCYYAYAEYVQGGDQWVVLTAEEVDQFRDRSANYQTAVRFNNQNTPWHTDYAAMAKKTCVRRLFTWLPSNPELAHGVTADGRVSRWAPGKPTTVDEVDAPELVPELPDGVVADEDGQLWEDPDARGES